MHFTRIFTKWQEEDFQNTIATDRRKERLEAKIQDLSADLKREIKAREGRYISVKTLQGGPVVRRLENPGDIAIFFYFKVFVLSTITNSNQQDD